ncbi:hypothetical protein M408DRAFT_274598 [Serendipita vermifera MAFF 305830]|uniref:Uncharacterized protein n=1 Tax=Serendipita vermifera MAFF 305830 TaxID=933852 RepID=A0A0C2WY82_SERVB|nr:hypothetical protein M408DRAFT_274598 [Serendipita vermifera MAFF 305830]
MAMAISPTHSRPGLAMTFEELNKAKVLILDLLGWGLSPENLVEAGISKECLVPCLRELKLRLPSNIDLSDVVLFDPPPDINSPSNSPLPLASTENDVGQHNRHRNTYDGAEMNGVVSASPQREGRRPSGNYKRGGPPEMGASTYPGPTAPTERTGTSLLDRLLPMAEREGGHNVPPNASIDKGDSHMHASSADTIDAFSIRPGVPFMPPRGPRKQGKNTQGGRSAPVGRRKVQGHASKEDLN